jgi:hypothetical protein
MRQVVSAIKISTNLERIADQSATIARKSQAPKQKTCSAGSRLAGASLSIGVAIFRYCMRPFADGDCELAQTLSQAGGFN